MPSTGPRHIQAIELFAEVLGQMGQEAPASEFYGHLCRSTCELADLDRALMLLYDQDLRRVRPIGVHDIDTTRFRDAFVHVGSAPIARRALEEDRVQQVDGSTLVAEVPEEFQHLVRDRRILCVPVSAPGNWVGVMFVDRGIDAEPVDDDDLELLWTLGKAVALAGTARNATKQTELARQLQQRIDLAREIHDGVIQRLFGVSLALSATDDALAPEERARCADEVQQALGDLRAALQRPLSATVPPPTLASFSAVVGRLAVAHGDIHLRYEQGGDADIPEALAGLAQSVLAEAVRNARRHATPSFVEVRTRRGDDTFVLEVENDGVSAEPAPHAPGVGLRLVAFEALQHGGVLEFGPRGDDRWQVRLVVPLRDV